MKLERWQRIEDVYQRVVEAPPEDRMACLKTLCGDDADLEREVRSLLSLQTEAENFMNQPFDVDAFLSEKTALIGQDVGPYRILSVLGTGGMGIVFRAQDTRLERYVALKFLPHSFDPAAQRARFEREAKILAGLNHPHICTLHDVGRHEGSAFLVLELVEGETLAQRLKNGALPLNQVLQYSIEIAAALDKAHRHGVVHRDLKPGNIMLTKHGVKLLDFGLAKLCQTDAETAPSKPASSKTDVTAQGAIVGTLQYMAPEQLEGKDVDGRTDIFAFGSVLYEMTSGQKAFEAETQVGLMTAIMTGESAPLSQIQPLAPALLSDVVATCLAKDPDDRWQTARDLLRQLKWTAERRGEKMIPARPASQATKILLRVAGIAGIIVAIIAGYVVQLALKPAAVDNYSVKFGIPAAGVYSHAISRDGKYLAFVAPGTDNESHIHVRALDNLDVKILPGTQGAGQNLVWSPDRRFIAFNGDSGLKKIDVATGSVQSLSDRIDFAGVTWGIGDTIVFGQQTSGLRRVSSAGGDNSKLTDLDTSENELAHQFPHFLPDGKHFLYISKNLDPTKSRVCVASLDNPACKPVMNSGSKVIFSDGFLIFARQTALMGQQFDLETLELTGQPFLLVDRIASRTLPGHTAVEASNNSVLSFQTGSNFAEGQLVWLDRNGKQLDAISEPRPLSQPALSLDEKRVALHRADPETGTNDIWILDVTRKTMSRFTSDARSDERPVWSSDGSRIVFRSNRTGIFDLYEKDASNTGTEKLFLHSNVEKRPEDFSLDGKYFIYQVVDPKTAADIWVLPLFGDRKPFPFINADFGQGQAQLSPDGRWLAYVSNESGTFEIYVQPFPQSGAQWHISDKGGLQARWRRDGKELFYIARNGDLMSVDVLSTNTGVQWGAPKRLFATGISTASLQTSRSNYAVSADGQRILLMRPVQSDLSSSITVITNWSSTSKK